MKNETFDRVHFDGWEDVIPLYQRTRHDAAGKPIIAYLTRFTDWQGIRRKVFLGPVKNAAIRKIYELDKKNHVEVDFDEQKQKRAARGMTLAKFITKEVDNEKIKSPWHKRPLLGFFGNKAITKIDNQDILDYRKERAGQKIIKHGKESAKAIGSTSINKELTTLRIVLRFARTKGYHDQVTDFAMATENYRNRTITEKEYSALLEHSPSWLRRAISFAWETALSRSDLFQLTWFEIDLNEGIIELRNGRAKTGKPQAVPIDVPGSTLRALIEELQIERHRAPSTLALTMDGQPIDQSKFEYHFRRACKNAGIEDFTFHDLRHCAISRWAMKGVPAAAAMLAAGHTSLQSHKRYQNLTKTDLKTAFGAIGPLLAPGKVTKQKIERK